MGASAAVVQAAHDMLARGYAIVPVREGTKAPAVERGENWRRQWTETEVLRALSDIADHAHRAAGIGFLGGALNKGIVPLDFDSDAGEAWWREQCHGAGIDPDDFPTVITPGKTVDGKRRQGTHRYVHDTRGTLGNREGALKGLNINIRGAGHVVLPPSTHPEGGVYRWEAGKSLYDFEHIPPCPDFIYDAIAKSAPKDEASGKQKQGTTPDTRMYAWCRAALGNVKSTLAGCGRGNRNTELNTGAYKLGAVAHYGAFSRGEALAALEDACMRNGLIQDDGRHAFEATFASGWTAGEASPRTVALEDRSNPNTGNGPEPQPAGTDAKAIPAFTQWDEIAEDALPARRWIIQGRLLRGEVTLLAAPGGTGKSLFDVLTALAVASGRDITGEILADPCPVWMICNEDSSDEMKRRILAAMRHFSVPASAIKDRLFITGADGPPIVLFDNARDTPTPTENCAIVTKQAAAWGCGLVIMDSLTTLHRSQEIDNTAMDAVLRGIIAIGRQADCAISLTTHTRKPGAGAKHAAGDMDSIRGGTGIVAPSRAAKLLATMSEGLAAQYGIEDEDRRRYLRMDDAKGNYAELDPHAKWFKKLSVELANGDGVGVLEPWTPPGALDGVTAHHLRQVQDAIAAAAPLECRADRRSTAWVGFLIAPIVNRDIALEADAAAVNQMILTWIRNRVLKTEREKEPRQGRMVPVVRCGRLV